MYKVCFMIALPLLYLVGGIDGCDIAEFQRCATDFAAKYPDSQNSYKAYDQELLARVCMDATTYRSCSGRAVSGCSKEVKMIWEVMDNSLHYICTDNSKQVFKTFYKCMNKPEIESGVSQCNSSLISAMTSMQYSGATKSEVCRVLKNFSFCVADTGTRHCNNATVGRWYGGLTDASLGPTKELYGCSFRAGAPGLAQNPLFLVFLLLCWLLHLD